MAGKIAATLRVERSDELRPFHAMMRPRAAGEKHGQRWPEGGVVLLHERALYGLLRRGAEAGTLRCGCRLWLRVDCTVFGNVFGERVGGAAHAVEVLVAGLAAGYAFALLHPLVSDGIDNSNDLVVHVHFRRGTRHGEKAVCARCIERGRRGDNVHQWTVVLVVVDTF
jgi:hypothetical protein